MIYKMLLTLMLIVAITTTAWAGGESNQSAQGQSSVSSKAAKIDINHAQQTKLEVLPGIGPAIAKRVVQYRQQNGDFESIQDLTKVKGIGSKTIKQISDFVKV